MATITIPTKTCFFCGEKGSLVVDSEENMRYVQGALIQDAFRSLSADEREQIITGTHAGGCSKKWDEIMSAPDEEEEIDTFGDDLPWKEENMNWLDSWTDDVLEELEPIDQQLWYAPLAENEKRQFLKTDLLRTEGTAEYVRVNEEDANLVSSKLDTVSGDWHAPVLDLDIPHRLVPSTTDGHSHLYLDIKLSFQQYVNLLYALAEAGVIERGYANASINKGFSSVRKPGQLKTDEEAAADATRKEKGLSYS